MPAEYVHLSIAARVADALDLDAALRSAFVLGAVATDVNNPLGWPRQATHFWSWPDTDNVSGAPTLLARHPQLEACHLTPLERAFVAGYLSHLIGDEQEVMTLSRPYLRPFVAQRAADGSTPDRRELRLASLVVVDAAVEADDPGQVRRSVAELRAATSLPLRDDLLPFVSLSAVRAWAAQTLAVAGRPASWPRVMPHRADEALSADVIHRVELLQTALRRVLPQTAIRAFVERATGESVGFLEAYLAGQPLPTPAGTTPLPPGPTGTHPAST